MPKKPIPIGGPHFSSVRKAREALRERAFELLDGYIAVIKQAAAAGDYETAAKGYQHLLEHMPDEDGTRMIDMGIDKPKQIEAYSGPAVQIGIQLGGIAPKALPPPITVDVIPVESDGK